MTLLPIVDIMDIVLTRRDVRAVYGAGLENQRRVKASEGSNPSLSSSKLNTNFLKIRHGEVLKLAEEAPLLRA